MQLYCYCQLNILDQFYIYSFFKRIFRIRNWYLLLASEGDEFGQRIGKRLKNCKCHLYGKIVTHKELILTFYVALSTLFLMLCRMEEDIWHRLWMRFQGIWLWILIPKRNKLLWYFRLSVYKLALVFCNAFMLLMILFDFSWELISCYSQLGM